MNHDIKILRNLANQYAQIAHQNELDRVWELHASVNDLHPQRPIVLLDEIPWHELNVDGSLTLQCEDPEFRQVEEYLRQTLFQHKYFPGDMLIKPYFPVVKTVHHTGIGVDVKEEILSNDDANSVVSHKYVNQFHSIEDVEKLENDIVTYDKEDSLRRFYKISEAIADILPVKLTGEETGYGIGHKAWDTIATFMSVDDLLYNLIDEPELMHALVRRLTDIFIDMIRQYEEQNLLNPDSTYCHCSAAASRDLQKNPIDYEHVKASNVWGRGLAQILATVSPTMHEEFEIDYAIEALRPFGMVYYGCCEPLDRKIDILRKIPNLRKISITPWADIHIAAEAIGKDYVISAKPNPANLLYAASEPDVVRKEIRTLLHACRETQTPCELLLKDISTVKYNLQNLVVWNQIAREEIESL
ncbi:MAG: hypothetical protein SOT28_12740 [Fusicatenibacter sp.]|nr:hypothetical protein [Lachnospiraceae bacterium]MDY2939150.1 hypothetical protein [Fusicatenibacter sp.]